MKHSFLTGALVAIALSFSSISFAGVMFDPSNAGSSATANITSSFCVGCSISTTLSDLNSQSAILEIGESATFDFFDITVGGLFGGAAVNIEATLALLAPGGSATNSGSGGFVTAFGTLSGGALTWNAPVMVDLGNGTTYTVAFENILTGGLGNTTNVGASVTLNTVAVSEPGTLALLGLGLAGLGFARRKTLA